VAQEPGHSGDKIDLGRLDGEMKMMVHETIGVHQSVGLGASLGKRGEDRARILDAQLPGHVAILFTGRVCVNTQDCP